MGDDNVRFSGLDPDERADVERVLADDGRDARSGPHPDQRRVVWLLFAFVMIYLPIVFGTFFAAERWVYRPLCADDARAAVSEVEIDIPFDATLGGGSSDGRTTCVYEDGGRAALQDVMSVPFASALDIALQVTMFGLPFVVIYVIARVTRR